MQRVMERFREVIAHRHEYAQQWKQRTGGKVMGYLCTYTPEEIIYAADILPVRIMGSHEPQDVVEPYIYSMYCSYCRDCLAQGLTGKYAYLDGLAHAHSCVHIRSTYASWERNIPLDFFYYLYMPSSGLNEYSQPFLAEEYKKFKKSLGTWRGAPISLRALRKAIKVYDENRRLLHQLYELRKNPRPPITGAEAMEIVLASMFMDKAEHSQLLKELLAGLPPEGEEAEIRLMVLGSEHDEVELIKLIEQLGSRVVIDDLCVGSRYFWGEVGSDGLEALASRYLNRPPCPVKDLNEELRVPHIIKLAEEYQVQGVIMLIMKFCDPHGYDAPFISSKFQAKGIPVLALETDVTLPAGQFRTRIEAFLEMMRSEVLF